EGEVSSVYASTGPNVQLMGVTPGIFPARNWIVREGRALQDSDIEAAHNVCVLGHKLAETVFPFGSGLGQRVKLNGINYRVVGILAPRGGMLGGDQDNFAAVPITGALHRYGRIWWSLSILVQAQDPASYDDTVEQVRGALRALRKTPPGAEDDFEVFSN